MSLARLTPLALLAALASAPAGAAHCPHGEFYRVRLMACVGLETPQAQAYLHSPANPAQSRARDIAPNLARSRPADDGARGPDGRPIAIDDKPSVASPAPFVMPGLDWRDEADDEGLLRLGLLRARLGQ